jgi:predicted DCC family thiol-disulfide oxidoreductase YuxK
MENPAPTKVFYNSACPICDAGISVQKRKMTGCDVEWIDVHQNPDAVLELGADLEFVRKRLHVKDENGHVTSGASAFAVLWAKSPGQHIWARLIRPPVLKHIARGLYNLFAAGLYKWNRWRKHW